MKNLFFILVVLPSFIFVACNKKDEPSLAALTENVEVQKNKINGCLFDVVETSHGLEVKTFTAKGSCAECKNVSDCQEVGTKLEQLIGSIDQVLARGPRQSAKNYMDVLRPEVQKSLEAVNTRKGLYQAEEDRQNKLKNRAHDVESKFAAATGLSLSGFSNYSIAESVVNLISQIAASKELVQAIKVSGVTSVYLSSTYDVPSDSYGSLSFNPYSYIIKNDMSFNVKLFMSDLATLHLIHNFKSVTGISLDIDNHFRDEKVVDSIAKILESSEGVQALKRSAIANIKFSMREDDRVESNDSTYLSFNPYAYFNVSQSQLQLEYLLKDLLALPSKQDVEEYKTLLSKIESKFKQSPHCSEAFTHCRDNMKKIAAVMNPLTFDGRHYLSISIGKESRSSCESWDGSDPERNPIFVDATTLTDEQLVQCLTTGTIKDETKNPRKEKNK